MSLCACGNVSYSKEFCAECGSPVCDDCIDDQRAVYGDEGEYYCRNCNPSSSLFDSVDEITEEID